MVEFGTGFGTGVVINDGGQVATDRLDAILASCARLWQRGCELGDDSVRAGADEDG